MRMWVIAIGALVVGVLAGSQMPCRMHGSESTTAATQMMGMGHEAGIKPGGLPASGARHRVLGFLRGIRNFVVQYDDKLYRGGELQSEEGAANLTAWGVKTVLSVVPSDQERLLCKTYGLDLVEVPFEKTVLTDEALARALAVYRRDTPVYVHCHGGAHRGGALAVLYRMAVQGWNADEAIQEYEDLGGDPHNKDKPMMDAIRAYVVQLRELEQRRLS